MGRKNKCDKISEFLPVIKSALYTSKNISLKENITPDIIHGLEFCKYTISETAPVIVYHKGGKFCEQLDVLERDTLKSVDE
jgi:hypothetical protein